MPNLQQPPFAASLVAKWFIKHAQSLADQDLDNLKLQKLLFLAHARSLSECDLPLLRERVEAWRHGPVVQTVYRELSEFDDRPIEMDLADDGPWDHLPQPVVTILSDTWEHFGAYSGWHLRELTHEVGPWRSHFVEGVKNIAIPNDEIQASWVVFRNFGAAPLPGSEADGLTTLRSSLNVVAARHPVGVRSGDPSQLVDQLNATQALRDEAAGLLK